MTVTEKDIIVTVVSPDNQQVKYLVAILDRYQIFLYGINHCNLDSIDNLKKNQAFMLGAYDGEVLVGIGAIKLFDEYAEIKRMFVDKQYHGTGVAASILSGLELYARQHNKSRINLETGNRQFAAVRFYEKHGYTVVEKFGTYQTNLVSIYFEKLVTQRT